MKLRRVPLLILIGLLVIIAILVSLVWAITFHPAEVQPEAVTCSGDAPTLQPGQSLKLLTYNIQYLAGKNYFFWYEGGQDERPSTEDISQSAARVAQIIQEENPDIVLLQEVDDGSKRADYEDQLVRLLNLLPNDYHCHASAFYWKAAYVPHPKVRGAIGHKLAIVSKYQIADATRYQLALAPADPLSQQFSPKRAMLETRLPVEGGPELVVLTTHLEVADRGAAVMQQQVAQVNNRLRQLSQSGQAWIIGGDFNLLPPGQYQRLRADQQTDFRPQTELRTLFEAYQSIPNPTDINANEQRWLTMNLNDPSLDGPDRTLDYFFFADSLELANGFVRQDEVALIASDHLPVVIEVKLP